MIACYIQTNNNSQLGSESYMLQLLREINLINSFLKESGGFWKVLVYLKYRILFRYSKFDRCLQRRRIFRRGIREMGNSGGNGWAVSTIMIFFIFIEKKSSFSKEIPISNNLVHPVLYKSCCSWDFEIGRWILIEVLLFLVYL